MGEFIHDDFLLGAGMARRLYHEVAAEQPIIDYHCHLPPADIAADRRFKDLFEIWLEGDHYKWRAMRSNGIEERFCTGDAPPKEKFLAWARTTPMTLRNPLYHWSHLELRRYFGISDLLSGATAESVWERANARLAEPDFSAHGILRKMRVEVVCTTDDPTDTLEHHRAIAASGLETRVYPAFRPDKAMFLNPSEDWNAWCDRLAEVSGCDTGGFDGFLAALRQRHDFFHENGARLSDHGLNYCPARGCSEAEAQKIFAKARGGKEVSAEEIEKFGARLMLFFGHLDHEKGWVKQLHLGAQRNNNTRKLGALGRDTGFDSIGDWPQAEKLAWYLDALDQDDRLPKTILYNLNPADNYMFAAMIGNFNDGSTPGKVQFGSGWWFLDQLEGMEWQLNALSNLGLLSRFVGMLTDSRSFMSYPRHEYFRRLLCGLLGREAEQGLLPDDFGLLSELVARVSYRNAAEYFGFGAGG